MRRNSCLGATLALWLLGMGAGTGLAAGNGPKPAAKGDPVRIGMPRNMFRDIPPAMLNAIARPFKALMESQTGMRGEIEHLSDAFTLARQLEAGTMHLGVFHSFEYAWVREKYPNLHPLVVAVPVHRKLQVCLVVRNDSEAKSLSDLKGCKVALPTGTREYCRLYFERQQACACPSGTFCEITCPECIEDALHAVVDGDAQGAVVDAGALASFERRHPGRFAKLKVISRSEVFPPSVIVYRKDVLNEETLTRFRKGLTGATQTFQGKQLMTLWKLQGFEPIPADYDTQLNAIHKAYPSPQAAIEQDPK